ncbi:MAG: amidophosphoribosyltransferase [Armatimonadetes bacterium]|nr:amidophosphoribosyltransferase [Armatimonadota bacterium]
MIAAAQADVSEGGADKAQDECGVFGIYAENEDVARITYFGLFALQHRGQESAGIATVQGDRIWLHKRMGLVTQVFDEAVLREGVGHAAIGHTRYSTTGSSVVRNAQPIVVETPHGPVAVAHNGNLLNAMHLRTEMELDGIEFESTNDSEVIARSIALNYKGEIVEAIRETMKLIHGAYSLVILTPEAVYGVRDPYGLRPLAIGQLPSGNHVLSSETCALHVIGAEYVREVEPGEIVRLDRRGLHELPGVPLAKPSLCVLEFIYMARPDSHMYGRSLHLARRRMGQEMAKEHPANGAHIVIPVPDTGIPAAIGFAEASRVPFGEGLIKSRYIHRTFIQPEQSMRDAGVKMKFTPLKEELAGKKVVMVDDSIVRGTTTRKLVKLLFEAGAAEVHVRISSPPVKWPCFYGIDMANQDQLIAATMSTEEIRRHIGATSLGYLSLPGVMRAIRVGKENFCTACFSGQYPIDVPNDLKLTKMALEPVG